MRPSVVSPPSGCRSSCPPRAIQPGRVVGTLGDSGDRDVSLPPNDAGAPIHAVGKGSVGCPRGPPRRDGTGTRTWRDRWDLDPLEPIPLSVAPRSDTTRSSPNCERRSDTAMPKPRAESASPSRFLRGSPSKGTRGGRFWKGLCLCNNASALSGPCGRQTCHLEKEMVLEDTSLVKMGKSVTWKHACSHEGPHRYLHSIF